MKKGEALQPLLSSLFLRIRSTYRTYAGAGAALDSEIRIDLIFSVAFFNSVNRTFRLAGAAADAVIIDTICHWNTPPQKNRP